MNPLNSQEQIIADMQAQIQRLRSDLDNLGQSFFKNNFSSSQTFNKDVTFQTRLRVPNYSTPPTNATVGEIIEIGGLLYICTTAGDVLSPAEFTAVGTQWPSGYTGY